jgi:hypothetical protein
MHPTSFTSSGETPIFSPTELAESANEKLEQAVNEATHRAFNLGCLVGLLPAVIFALVIFLSTGFSFIGTAMAVVLGIVSAMAFANLAAMITRNNTVRNTYTNMILPEIEQSLSNAGVERQVFDQAARESLSPSAALYPFVGPAIPDAPIPSDGEDDNLG